MLKKINYVLAVFYGFSQLVFAMDSESVREKPIDFSPSQFEWNELLELKNKPIFKSFNGCSLKLEPVDATKIQEAWPSSWQVVSSYSLLSRITKQDEQVLEDLPDVSMTLSSYEIGVDTLGYGPYYFDLKCTITALEDDFELISDRSDISTVENAELPTGAPQKTAVGNQKKFQTHSSEYYNIRAISNVTQLAQGSRIRPSLLRASLFSSFDSENHWQYSAEQYYLGQQELPLYKFVHGADKTVAVFSPAHDLCGDYSPIDNVMNGGLSLKDIMLALSQNDVFQQGAAKVFVPIAQSNGFRKHWTLLVLDKSHGGDWTACHFDSKGISSAYYGLGHIVEDLAMINCKAIDYKYLGHQGLINNSDCGRFVIQYILYLLENVDLKELSTADVTKNFKSICQF